MYIIPNYCHGVFPSGYGHDCHALYGNAPLLPEARVREIVREELAKQQREGQVSPPHEGNIIKSEDC